MPMFSDDVQAVFRNFKQDALLAELEDHHSALLERRTSSVMYGDPDKLSPKKRALLNGQVLNQALLHRADSLLRASGPLIATANGYGLALIARGHFEATAKLAYFCDRIDAYTKGNIEFEKYENNVADAVMGTKHETFPKANDPTNIMTCVEKGDRFLDGKLKKKTGLLLDCYRWLSEFAHPNYCSNKLSFELNRETKSLDFQHEAQVAETHFELLSYLSMSAGIFPTIFDEFDKQTKVALTE